MNQHLQIVFAFVEATESLTAEEKSTLIKALKAAEKELMISEFKLERTEKVKRTTAILLEETIEELEQKRTVVEESRAKLQQSLEDLEAAKDQLVQQEKLASLGQLTAGIAHEIKNPLNFVNNFSELSVELVEEAREEIKRETKMSPFEEGKDGEAGQGDDHGLILEILNDIEANLRKIHEHGSRADSIVKSMLQHSRGGDGIKEATDLNALIKEYVNLAFHGMRAGKNPINVDIELDLDEKIGEVSLIHEDFSRVILNLCNNAFDAMREKTLSPTPHPEGEGDYLPKLTVRTARKDGNIFVEIEDNGPGIPEEMKDKIMQPFFTTKKGTEGTGLGLSITNDIIKAHGGDLTVETNEGEGSRFIISIPMGKSV
jgi:signal transduction histidine kinase